MNLVINPHIARVACSKTGDTVDVDYQRPIGLHNGMPVVFEYDIEAIRRQDSAVAPDEAGMWHYAPLLPVSGVSQSFGGDVGRTPIVRHEALSQALGVELFLKNEGVNPSGSFKDRGLAMGIALGLACGAKRFCLPTQGNAGVAASMFSARAGIQPALVYMPEGHRGSIYHRSASSYGAEVRFFGANIGAAGKRMREDLAEPLKAGDYVDISTFFEPGRLEGKKTMGFEIAESFGNSLPDVIYYPTGGGTGLVGIWKAFAELRALGIIGEQQTLPRMVAVQSDQCAPVVTSFERGLDAVEPITSKGTLADGLDVPGAIMGHSIMRTLRGSAGMACAVSEDAIVTQYRRLGAHGVSASFEGGATLAAVVSMLEKGQLKKGERVLLLITAGQLVALSSAGGLRLAAG